MATVSPPQLPSSTDSQLKTHAQKGFSNAAQYDAHRPSYPPHSVETLLSRLGVSGVAGARVLDLAAGTGKFTELLAARPEGYEIRALEPHADMRAQLASKATAGKAGWNKVSVEDGFADKMNAVPDGWADAVVVAQAFHWFANMDALREIHRVLAPGATLGLIWNVEDYNQSREAKATTEYEEKLNELIWSLDDNEPRYRHLKWRQVFDDQLKSDPLSIQTADPLFSLPLGEQSDHWQVNLSKQGVWDRLSTISHVANQVGDDKERARKAVQNALEAAPTNDKGEVAVHGVTVMAWTTAIPTNTLRNGG